MALALKEKIPLNYPPIFYIDADYHAYFAFRQFQIDVILIWDFATGAMICLVLEKSHGASPRTETTKFLHRLLQDKTTERNLVRQPAIGRCCLITHLFIFAS